MKIRSKALCLASTLVAWIITASPVDAAVDSTGHSDGGAVFVDSAHGLCLDDATEHAIVGAAPETAVRTALPGSHRTITATLVLSRPRIASGNVSSRGPPTVF